MLKSMTGYGRHEELTGGKKVTVEIRSVNHRFSDYTIKVPKNMGFLEDKVRKYSSEHITRGKIDISVNVESYDDADKDIILNEELAGSYINALHELCRKFNLKDDISVSSAAAYPEIFKAKDRGLDEDEIWAAVKSVLEEAMSSFIAMRSREGERIEKDLRERIEYMRGLVSEIDEYSPKTVEEYRERLYAKIKELVSDRDIDEARILTEAAIFADKVAVNEETVRLGSHFDEFNTILDSGEPAGRRLDFLIQEINREVNTIGSKSQNIDISKIVVELKAETEKLREQIQNIE